MELTKIYHYALQREREGRDFFASNAKRVSHAAAKDVFERLVREEESHIVFVQHLIDAQKEGTQAGLPEPALAEDGFFAKRAESEMLDQTVIESMIPDVTVLRMAYLIERDIAEFYEMAASQAEDESKQALLNLARWERGHEQLFKMLHDRVFQEYAKMPWGG